MEDPLEVLHLFDYISLNASIQMVSIMVSQAKYPKTSSQIIPRVPQISRPQPLSTFSPLSPPLLTRVAIRLPLIRMLRRIKHIHRPLAPYRPLHDRRQPLPHGLRHRDQDARLVQPLLVLGPAGAFLIAFLRTWAFLEWEARDEEEEEGEEDEADEGGVERGVGAGAGGDEVVGGGGYADDVDCCAWRC